MNFRCVHTCVAGIQPLLDQLQQHEELWSTETEWTRKKPSSVIYKTQNIVLRYVTLGAESGRLYLFEDERNRDNWNRPAASILIAAWPIVFDVARAVYAEHIGHVIITRMAPGEEIATHVDRCPALPGLPYWQRHQVPLQSDEGVVFRCDDEEKQMRPGRAYWFDNQKPHSVHNNSARDRISMIVELRPLCLGT